MSAQHAKQRLKNAVYRAVGEVGVRAGGARDDRLRALMYHKVDAVSGNTISVPPTSFAAQMAALARGGYCVVGLDAVLAHYRDGAPLPPRPVLITFDDGYRDNLERALPILREHGYPAVLFAPTGFVGTGRVLPHDEHLVARGIHNPVVDWDELRALDAGGVRVESHGVSHRPFAELDRTEILDELRRSKARLEQELGRPVEAFSFPRGSALDVTEESVVLVQEAGYAVAFATTTGSNAPGADRFRLRRYNVEPYSVRTFELVLRGGCDALRVKDGRVGTHARRVLNATFRTGPT